MATLNGMANGMAVWLVTGEASTESGTGGVERWIYVTDDALTLPDVRSWFTAPGSLNGRAWYQIDEVRCLSHAEELELIGSGEVLRASFGAMEP